MSVTPAMLQAVAPSAHPEIVAMICDRAPEVFPRVGLVSLLRVQHFLAQCVVESAYLTALEENLNYSAERLCQVWPHRFPTLGAATPFAHNPKILAKAVYGGRMGNDIFDDGWTYRGQGLIQITGKDNYQSLATYMHSSLGDVSEKIMSHQDGLECAALIFQKTGALVGADDNDIYRVTRSVRGACTGADVTTRLAMFHKLRNLITHL